MKESNDKIEKLAVKRPTNAYLENLITDTLNAFENFSYSLANVQSEKTTYICTKKRNMMGILSGFRSRAEMNTYKVGESQNIRQNCKYYNKFYKSNGKINKIECFAGDHNNVDVIYIAHYVGALRYLFPYFSDMTKAVGYYIVVTRFENNDVIEEFMVKTNQIIYEKYEYSTPEKIEYYCINYVPTGSSPILDEEKGFYNSKSFEYCQKHNFAWFENHNRS